MLAAHSYISLFNSSNLTLKLSGQRLIFKSNLKFLQAKLYEQQDSSVLLIPPTQIIAVAKYLMNPYHIFYSSIDQDDSLPNQPFHGLCRPRKYLLSGHLMTDPAVRNSNLGEKSPTTFYPRYSYPNQDPMPPGIYTRKMASNVGLGSQLNPIVLGSDNDDIVYQEESLSTAYKCHRMKSPRLYTQNPEDAKLCNIKRKSECAGATEGEGSFFLVDPAPPPRGMTVPSGHQYQYQELKETRTYSFKPTPPSANEDLSFFPPGTFDNQPTTNIWGGNLLINPYQPLPSNHLSYPIPGSDSKNIVDLDQPPAYVPFPPTMAVPPGKPMDPCIESSRSPGVGLRRKASAVLSPDVPADFQKIQTFFAQFLGEERSVTLPCPHGPSALSSIFDVIKSVDRKKGANLPYNHHGKTCFFKCPECKMIVCAGCGSKVGKLRVPFSDISHRCIDAYLLSFVLVLAKIDARWQLREFSSRSLAPQKKVNASASAMASTSIQTKTLPPLQHVSLTPPSKSRAGTGYGTGQVGGRKSASRKIVKTAAKIKQESEDNNYLTGLLGRLVRLTADGAGELSMTTLLEERKDLLVSIIKVSYLPELIGSLVCNDSIMDIDIHNTWEMYSMCLNLLQFFSAYEPLLEFLVTGPQEKKSSPGIANLIKMPNLDQLKGFAPNKKRMGVLATLNPVEFVLAEGFDGIGQSIVHSLPRLAKQCQAFMNNASRLLYQDEETKRLLSLCDNVETTAIELDKRAQELREKKDKARPSPPYKNSHPASFSPDSLAHPIFSSSRGPFSSTSAQKSNPFGVSATVQQECRHALSGYLQFNYSYKVIDTHSSANPHTIFYGNNPGHSSATIGCMRRLAKELTVLATGLPPGIYIRVQEDRLDFFKAIIVGPESSPYHLGLYEFDFTIPPDYPNTPPLVTFKTTGGARVRFNPNLYETGKVCLSILGTWGGSASEQWQPKTSTLLQVLVSIQGMILCAEPYYNEPGYEQMFAPKASKSYNQNVQLNSMRLAMADWLAYSGLWDEVVQAHFLAYAEEILSTTRDFVNKTSNNDAPPHNTAGFAIPQPMPAFGNQLHPLMPTHDSMKTVMENMRQVLEDTMKFRLPKFLAAGLWKEPSDSINLTDSVDESSE